MRNVKNVTAEEAICMMKIMQSLARFAVLIPKGGGSLRSITETITESSHAKMAVERLLKKNRVHRQ